ncbi:MAG: hypothetical protein ABI729_09565 [Chitinophagales bacterium]
MPNLLYLSIGLLLLQSCITTSEVGQEATTLPKHVFEIGAEAGIIKASGGMRYGLLNKIDVGAYYQINLQDNHIAFPGLSTDFKWQLLGTPEKHFVFSSGLGFGTGIERTTLYNEDYYHSEEESIWMYGATSLDAYLPLYFTFYLPQLGEHFFFNCNPYLIYRFGFYEWEYTGNSYQEGFWNYRPMKQLNGGTAFSIGASSKRSSFKVVLNILLPTGHPEAYGNAELYATYGFRFNIKKDK